MKKLLKKLLIFATCFAFIVGGIAIMGNVTVQIVKANDEQVT